MKDSSCLKILAVDTASLMGSVALVQGETVIAESLLNVRSTHSEKLLQQIDALLSQAGWTLAEIDLFAVVDGPGSFTGLRIGLATVKGLAQVMNKPVAAVSALQVAALAAPFVDIPVCAVLDARKKEVYAQVFTTRTAVPQAAGPAQVLAPTRLLEQFAGEVIFVGDGVPVYRDLIVEALHEKALLPAAVCHQRYASQVAWLALQAWRAGAVVTAEYLKAVYIRPSDAELNLPAKPMALRS